MIKLVQIKNANIRKYIKFIDLVHVLSSNLAEQTLIQLKKEKAAQGLTKAQVREFKTIFTKYDDKDKGFITMKNLSKLITSGDAYSLIGATSVTDIMKKDELDLKNKQKKFSNDYIDFADFLLLTANYQKKVNIKKEQFFKIKKLYLNHN